jgi:cytidylate kinase
MQDKNKSKGLNLIVSSWPSAGGTTVALVLADTLNLKYIYAGGVFKEWAKRAGFDPATNEFHEWESKYGESWDYFWEDYILNKVSSEENFLSEGKTAGFLLDPENAYEIMLIASGEERARRAGLDKRKETIKDRDNFLRKRWMKLFNIDFMDLEQIEENYDLIFDNTEIGIIESLELILKEILDYVEKNRLKLKVNVDPKEINLEKYKEQASIDKNLIRDSLRDKGLFISNEDIFQEWKDKYSEKLSKLPKLMQEALR